VLTPEASAARRPASELIRALVQRVPVPQAGPEWPARGTR
jgi:MoxR-like ATPase